ncbi:hypothetical protein, partial [Nocardia cyriacigeorgica]|uniref:hypothetical protein n=1 Tax=Nocardia cyriacigeorgica TaxID=135487 RepID=UPI0024568464
MSSTDDRSDVPRPVRRPGDAARRARIVGGVLPETPREGRREGRGPPAGPPAGLGSEGAPP